MGVYSVTEYKQLAVSPMRGHAQLEFAQLEFAMCSVQEALHMFLVIYEVKQTVLEHALVCSVRTQYR